ncbi:MAG TPA: FtsX-like permease family protein [Fimbriimonadaceae bacterium]|nr:FtsX-like permease family protein [Fimbriimonadaceae bacterium]
MSTPQNVDPPFRVAWNQAIASIRVRFWRHAVTVSGIGLGIAFFASVQTSRLLQTDANAFESERLQWLAASSLLMCLVGVTNSMLMSVSERYREIGTIKCLGASDGFIVKVFFLEAICLGLIGSLAGALLGSLAISLFDGFSLAAVLETLGIGSALGLAMTVVAAIAPAVVAARMPAAAALRVEV